MYTPCPARQTHDQSPLHTINVIGYGKTTATAIPNKHKKMKIIPTIEKYLIGIMGDEFHRYTSWDNCHQ
jgi:hypothetical protein